MNKYAEAMVGIVRGLIQSVQDRIAVMRLRWQIMVVKANSYDQLVTDLQGLMQALRTKDRQIADLNRKLKIAEEKFQSLRQDRDQLREQGEMNRAELIDVERRALFKKLESILVQLPSMRQAVKSGADISGQQVLDIAAPLESTLQSLGFESIGTAGAHIDYDSRLHRAVGKGARSVQERDPVRVRYIGYRYHDEVLAKAEVTAVLETEPVT